MTLRLMARKYVDQKRLLDRYEALVALDTKIIDDLQAKLTERADQCAQMLRQQALENTRDIQVLVCSWLIATEKPEIDMRELLADMECELANEIAKLEEHIL